MNRLNLDKYKPMIPIVLVVLLILTAVPLIVYLEQQSAKRTILSFNEGLKDGDIARAKTLFLKDAIFVYQGRRIHYEEALKNLQANVDKGNFTGNLKIQAIERFSIKEAQVGFAAHFTAGDGLGEVCLRRIGFWKWKIESIISLAPAFKSTFFPAAE